MACQCTTKITLAGNATVGDSMLNPLDASWLLAANKYYDWKCVETSDGINFNIHTDIEIGDGVNPTYFKDVGKNFRFDAGKDFILNPPAYLEVINVWTQAEKNYLLNKVDDIYNDTMQMIKVIKNKKELKKNGAVWELIIYDDDNITPILNKTIKDKDGNNITDLEAGTLAQEIKSSV